MEDVTDLLAQGIPQVLIAQSYGVPESTLGNWKKRKDFKRMLAAKLVAYGKEKLAKITDDKWLLERHTAFREAFAPPKQEVKQEVTGSIELLLKEIDGKGIPKPPSD